MKQRRYTCKRRIPFPVTSLETIEENGEWSPKRSHPRLNNFCPDVALLTFMNHDAKLLTNGEDTKDVSFYTTKYATKPQKLSHNASALAAKGLAYHIANTDYNDSLMRTNQLMLFRCLRSLNREMEYSGPQVITYLMGWGEHVRSHDYTTLYWSSVESLLKGSFPELKRSLRPR